MSESREAFEKRTREVFHRIHLAQTHNSPQMTRTQFVNSPEFMGVPPSFFEGKTCLEAGCGSFAPGSQNMLAAGAAKVYAMDLNETIFDVAPRELERFKGHYELKVGSVLDIPFTDGFFDFVICHGVLHAADDPLGGLREICRVTKPGGSIFISVQGVGGFMKAVTKVAHEMYESDPEWKTFIDGLSGERFSEILQWITGEMRKHGDVAGSEMANSDLARQLFDQDMVLTMFDRIKAPAYNDVPEADFLAVLDEFGFQERRRVHHYQNFSNARRFLAPLYNEYESPLARLMYGEGMLEYFATRAAK